MERLLVKGSAYCQLLNRLDCRLNREIFQQGRLLDITVQRDQQVRDSSLLNTSCGFNRVPYKRGPKLCRFSLHNDLFNHRNISCVSFFNHSSIYYLFNVYSDLSQLALKYLKDTEVDLNNILIMTGNFNIRDCLWDLNFQYHSLHKDTLFDITDSFQLEISRPM